MPKMPSCKKIRAFSAFLGLRIVAFALALAFNCVVMLVFTFGEFIIRAMASCGYISYAMRLRLEGAAFIYWLVVLGSGKFYDG